MWYGPARQRKETMRGRALGVILILWGLPWAIGGQPRYDLLLKGGHVLDPKNNRNQVLDVAIADGRIGPERPARPAPDARSR